MSVTERGNTIHDNWKKSVEQFDYFILGVAIALFGYFTSGLNITKFNLTDFWFSPDFYKLLAILALLISIIYGFKRIEAFITVFRIDSARVSMVESLQNLRLGIKENKSAHNTLTGHELTKEELEHEINSRTVAIVKHETDAKKYMEWGEKYYIYRNFCLILALALLIIFHVLKIFVK